MTRGKNRNPARACWVVFLGLFLLLSGGCKKSPEGEDGVGPSDPAMDAFRKRLQAAKTDDEKWAVVEEEYRDVDWQRDYRSLEDCMKRLIHIPVDTTEILLEHYPNIVCRLPWSKGDLVDLSRRLGSQARSLYDVETRRGLRWTRAYAASNMTVGEVASKLLARLTGKQFANKEEFDKWFQKNGEDLQWNPKQGKFEVPTVTGN